MWGEGDQAHASLFVFFLPVLVVTINAADHVRRDGLVDLFGVRQIQVGHNRHELLDWLCEPRVVRLLLAYGAAVSALDEASWEPTSKFGSTGYDKRRRRFR